MSKRRAFFAAPIEEHSAGGSVASVTSLTFDESLQDTDSSVAFPDSDDSNTPGSRIGPIEFAANSIGITDGITEGRTNRSPNDPAWCGRGPRFSPEKYPMSAFCGMSRPGPGSRPNESGNKSTMIVVSTFLSLIFSLVHSSCTSIAMRSTMQFQWFTKAGLVRGFALCSNRIPFLGRHSEL